MYERNTYISRLDTIRILVVIAFQTCELRTDVRNLIVNVDGVEYGN